MYIYTNIHIHTYIYIHIYIHTHIYIHIRIYIYIHTYTAPSDVIQGRLGDCWLLGALAIAAAKPNLLQSNVRFSWVAKGIHAIRFFVEVEFLKRQLATKFSL